MSAYSVIRWAGFAPKQYTRLQIEQSLKAHSHVRLVSFHLTYRHVSPRRQRIWLPRDLNLWPLTSGSMHAEWLSCMHALYVYTKFGVRSSIHFPFRGRTHKQTGTHVVIDADAAGLPIHMAVLPPSWIIYTVSQKKNDNDVLHYNFNAHQPILIIFGRDIAEWICY